MEKYKSSIFIFFFLLASLTILQAQSANTKKDELLNTNLSDFIENYSELSNSDFGLLGQNVFTYFELDEEYSSPLKKSNFVKSADYKILSDSLVKLKAEFKNTSFYVSLKGVDVNDKSEYNLKAGGFYFDTQSSYFQHVLQPKNTYEGEDDIKLRFLNLNTVVIKEKQDEYDRLTGIPAIPEQHIFIPCSSKIGELIEDGSSTPEVYIFFKPNSMLHNKQVDSTLSTVYNFKYEYVDYLNVTVQRIIVAVDDKIIINKTL
jgi:hypothetical protein